MGANHARESIGAGPRPCGRPIRLLGIRSTIHLQAGGSFDARACLVHCAALPAN